MTTANNYSEQPNTEQLRELLSPYLDGEVTAEERVLVEEAIATSPELRRDLETLRQTVSLLETLPPVSAPRPFTLSEAELGPPVSAPRRSWTVPPWLKSWAVVAATFLCVLAIGGVFVAQQFGGGMNSAPAEIAMEQAVEPEAAPAEQETFGGVPTADRGAPEGAVESAAEADRPAEELAEEAPQPEAQEAPALAPPPEAEEAAPAVEPQAEEAPEEAEQETLMAAEEPAEDSASIAGEAAEAEEVAPEPEAEEMEEAAVAKSADEAVAATPAPAGTPPPPAGLAEPTESPAAAAQEVMPAEEGLAESAAPPPAAAELPPEEPIERQSLSPRRVEIEDQAVEIRPGLIEIEGQIDASPGSVLLASLHREGEPFDLWADPASLRTLVQPEGRFSFTIQARPGVEQNLFGTEPAEYRVDITAVGVEEPVTASVFFDTAGPANPPTPTATVTPQPTATDTPQPTATFTSTPLPPSPTAEDQGTEVAEAEPSPATTPPDLPAQPAQATPPVTTVLVVGLVAFGVLVVFGLTAWWLVRKGQG